MSDWDAVVVGGGPAGLAAATWLARYRRRTLLVDAGEHRNRFVEQTHGYLTRDGASPAEILESACAGLDRYECVERRHGTVTAISGREGEFTVKLDDGDSVEAKRVVLATGVIDTLPAVSSVDEHYGASLFHCPSCDGYEARDCDVVVLGWSEHVAGFALELLDWAASVTIVTDGHRYEGDDDHRDALARHGVALVEVGAEALTGTRGDLRSVRLSDGRELSCQLAFFSIDHRPRAALADALGCEREGAGCVVVDEHGATTVPGVYAAGDLVPGYQLIQVAAAKGTTAGVGCAQSLRSEPPAAGGPRRAPDVPEVLGD